MTTLLYYNITTNSFPLRANAQSGNPNIAQTTVVGSNNSANDITLQSFVIKIPVRKGSTQLKGVVC